MIIRVNVWAGLLSSYFTTHWPGVCGHGTSRLNLILILSLSLRDYYPETARSRWRWPHAASREDDHHEIQWDEEPIILPCYLSDGWVAVKSAAVLFLGSLWRDWALARRERRGDPGLCVSAHPAAVTISAWRCLMPARPCQAELGQALDVETSPAQSPTLISLPSLLFGRKMSQNQIPRQDF